jgi:predicted transcriptional regulator
MLEECTHIKGVTAVLEKWRKIYSHSEKYVFDILSESPPETLTPLLKKISIGIEYRHIISKQFIEPDGRKALLEKMGYYKYVEDKKIQRRESKSVSVILVMNEKEAGIIFSTSSDEPDLRHMFYGKSAGFHEWCHDYFEYIWKKSKKISNHRFNKK